MPLSEFLTAGPQRREQLAPAVYAIYAKFGFRINLHKPEFVQEQLTTRPKVAYRATVWLGNIKPEDRNSTTLSDGAVFRTYDTAEMFGKLVAVYGGVLHSITPIENPQMWYETVGHYKRVGSMTVAEIEELKNHWRSLVEADEKRKKEDEKEQTSEGNL